jgi:hypothetical protein
LRGGKAVVYQTFSNRGICFSLRRPYAHFLRERVNDFTLLRRRRFGRCGFTRGNRRRHLIVASKPRSGLGYRLALQGLCDRPRAQTLGALDPAIWLNVYPHLLVAK